MAFISVTYTFVNGTIADATQVNTNFTNLVNGLSDGTKDISVLAGTFAGNVSVGGTLSVTSTSSFSGNATFSGTNNTFQKVSLEETGAGSDTIGIQAPSSISASYTLTLPDTDGSVDQVLRTDGSGVLSWINSPLTEGVWNLGVSYSAGTFTINGADGSALSASNPGFVRMRSATAGRLVTLKVTANVSFNDDAHASSDIVNQLWDTTAGVAWAQDMPLYLYAVNADDTDANLRFSLTRQPNATVTPATASIGYKGNKSTNNYSLAHWFLTSSDPTTSHDAVPCLRIGGIRVRKSASDDWTVQSLSSADGIQDSPYAGYKFNYPSGHHSSSVGYLHNATAPTFASTQYFWWQGLDGFVTVDVFFDGDGGTDGTLVNGTRCAVPVWRGELTFSHSMYIGIAYVDYPTSTEPALMTKIDYNSGAYFLAFELILGGSLTDNLFTNGSRQIVFNVRYRAF